MTLPPSARTDPVTWPLTSTFPPSAIASPSTVPSTYAVAPTAMADTVRLGEDGHEIARQFVDRVVAACVPAEPSDRALALGLLQGLTAKEMADRLHPQVIVTDLVMPIIDGLELIRRLAERPPPRSPVVAVSAVGSRLRAARELGAADVLLKPVDPADLLHSVRKAARTVH